MAKAPRKLCAKANCGQLTTERFCEKHKVQNEKVVIDKRKQYDKLRGTRTERGYDNRWIAYSKRYREAHPLCVKCEQNGLLELAQCVDHIIPVSGPDDPLFWEPTNHQGLCTPCHSLKTAKEDGAFGNTRLIRSI